jgi:hypothetical protein
MDKYGNLTKIQSEISFSNSMTGQMANEFTSNLETIEAERTDPKEILEKYYGEKLTEFQNHQKELLRIENRKPVPLEGVVDKYGILLMHTIYPSVERGSSENDAIKTSNIMDRIKTTLLKPALSTSTFRGQETIEHGYGYFGMVYGKESQIYMASNDDAGTRPTVGANGKKNFQERQQVNRSFDKDKSINTEIVDAIENRKVGQYGTNPRYNEMVIVGEPIGLNLFIDKLNSSISKNYKLRNEIEEVMQQTQELGLPIFGSVENKMYEIKYTSPDILANELNASLKKNNRYVTERTRSDIPFKDCITLVKEITPQDVMKMESPITWEKQIEIAKELSEKGIFDDTNLPISLRS